MAYSLRNMLTAISALLITSTGSVQGQASTFNSNANDCCLPAACVSCSCGQVFLDAEVLYLRAFEGGLSSVCDSTQINESVVDGTLISRLDGKNHDPDFRWNWGYRIGIGYEFADSDCGIGAYWTHYDSNSHSNNHQHGHSWKINFDAVDVLFGCDCECGSCFVVIPYAGLKYATIDQHLHSHFVSTFKGVTGPVDRTISKGHLKEDFWGVGPELGVEGDWDVGCGFSLYGDISVSILYGTFHVRSNQTDVLTTVTNVNHLRKHTQACQTVLDVAFGVRWQTCICNGIILGLQLGLEDHRYFNLNQFCGYGDLSLDGVSFGVTLAF